TAVFSLAASHAEYRPGQVTFDGTNVQIDVTSLGSHTQGQLVFQLVKGDSDAASTVTLTEPTSTVDPQGTAGPAFPVTSLFAQPGAALDLAGLTASTTLQLVVQHVRVENTTGIYTAEVAVQNNGAAVNRQVAVVFQGLPAGVTLANPSGTDGSGAPYVNF